MLSVGLTIIKYVMFVLNFLFAIIGLMIGSFGAVRLVRDKAYENFEENYFITCIVMILLGSIIFIMAYLACCGTIKENPCMMMMFALLLTTVFIVELVIGITTYVMFTEISKELEISMDKAMEQYHDKDSARNKWDTVQQNLSCCGMYNSSEWQEVGFPDNTLPTSCCSMMQVTTLCYIGSQFAFTSGCMDQFMGKLEHDAFTLGTAAIIFAIIQFIEVIFSCLLTSGFRQEKKGKHASLDFTK